ncbi:MAG: TonB-linked SusC/RagA family outer membrane protein [Sediminicola sp.]|jgi:TonB-linked SusC/RagA family outer membrane protein
MKFKLLKKLVFSTIFMFGSIAFAQTVSGVVTEASGPLGGVNILEKGTSNGVLTDFDGNYSISLSTENPVLVFSYIGYLTQEIALAGQTNLNVSLAEDAAVLDEVVVIGYGTTTVRDATGSIASVKAEDFNGGIISTPEQLIQGKTAGVQITSSSGEPGAGMAIRIRGTASVRSNNNPLFVVDGVPLSDGGSPGGSDLGFGEGSPRNPLAFLNPNDIESISILKDASATAIYGSRGANGVVIVTTKSGRAGAGGVFEFSTNLSTSTVANTFDLLGRNQFLNAIDTYGGNSAEQDFGSNTDWQDVIFRTATSTDNNFSYSNNYGDGNVRASFSYGKQFGVIQNSDQERITGRVNASHRFLDDKLKLSANVSFSRINDQAAAVTNNAGSLGDLLGATYFANPTWPNNPNFETGSAINPAQLLEYYQDKTKTNRILLSGSAEYSILDNLKAKVALGFDQSGADRRAVVSGAVNSGFNNGTIGNGRGTFQDINVKNSLVDFTLNYNKEFSNSKLDFLVGYSYQQFQNYGRTINGFGFGTGNLDTMGDDLVNSAQTIEQSISTAYQQYGYSNAGLSVNQIVPEILSYDAIAPNRLAIQSVTGDYYDNTDELQSFFGRANYTIAGKYLFTATMRADGSTRFGPNNQYGYFPSGAFAWQMQDEDFIPESVSTLKLRVSYGITGNQDGLGYGSFTRRQRFGAPGIANDGAINLAGTTNVAFQNDDLKWEETGQANLGFDFGFADDRLSGSLDFYHKSTKDLLLQQESAQPAVQPFVFNNLDATVINQGVEFAINYDIIQQDELTWNFGFNIAYNENEVQDFVGLIQTGAINGNGLTGAYAQLLAEGQPLFSYFLREFGGFDENGISIYPNGDVQEFVGKSALPDFNVGFSTNLNYKRFNFAAYFNGQYGQYIYNNTANAFQTAGIIGSGQNVTTDVLTNGESTANAPDVSTRFLEKGDFLRLANLTVGYEFPVKQDGAIKSLRFSLTGSNLFVITPYSGLDPEVDTPNPLNNIPSAGIDYTSFPRAKSYTLGINATF